MTQVDPSSPLKHVDTPTPRDASTALHDIVADMVLRADDAIATTFTALARMATDASKRRPNNRPPEFAMWTPASLRHLATMCETYAAQFSTAAAGYALNLPAVEAGGANTEELRAEATEAQVAEMERRKADPVGHALSEIANVETDGARQVREYNEKIKDVIREAGREIDKMVLADMVPVLMSADPAEHEVGDTRYTAPDLTLMSVEPAADDPKD